ncbi:MAG: DUF1295 domain-containing protein [Candidatus Heimdallarchaeum aukensis]|uniref:3-oxo-5-alpha-steroid 4-dehydrogenase 1 n=1 Tax=Candidatus Heimdallarchaeum aukensis TaxID=2876573 RepID=A0A9Y1BM98_9ARCH|nr:MAG: DUF1295 domain-containing protein [Candidatus Heimdallarchaeum aukensis]
MSLLSSLMESILSVFGNPLYFKAVMYVFLGLGVSIFILLFFITAPYGRHRRKGWGPTLDDRVAWFIMEFPSALLMAIYFFGSERIKDPVFIVFIAIFEIHYIHRALIYPWMLRGRKKMPILIMLFGVTFNLFNTYIQGIWLFYLVPENMYTNTWFYSPQFIIGIIMFITGFFINKQSDHILRNLREKGAKDGYKIPYGGMFKFVSSPNYLGEIMEWIGWAILTWSVPGLVFALWTFFNLAPRARAHHNWYQEKFTDYPNNRKALIPFLF